MEFGKVLVTGGAGFIGSQLLKRLLPMAEHIYVIDNLTTGNRSAIPQSDNITFYEDSITNEQLLEQIMPEVDTIYHLACRNLQLSVVDMDEDYSTNLYGGYLLLKHAKLHCPKLKRFVYTSTASVYGNAEILPTPETYYQIALPYSASKFATEHYCQVYYHMYQLPITIIRLSNVYGPGQVTSNPYCGVVARFFEAVEQGEPLSIYGDGTQTRDFTFVEDAIEALVKVALDPMAIGQVYNVGTAIETRVQDLAEMVMEITDYKVGKIEYLPKRPIDRVYRRAVDIHKIQQQLHWTPKYSLYDGLVKTYEWVKNR